SAGSFLMGVSFRFESLILGNALAGLGTAGIHPVSSSIIAQKWMKRKVGLALSLFYGLGYVGNIIGPLVLSAIALWAGWRFSYYLIAATFLGCGILAFFMLRGEQAAEKSTSKQSSRFVDDVKSALKIKDAMLIIAAQAFISGGTGMGVMTTWVPLFIRDPSKGLGLDVWTAGLVSSIAMSGGVIGTILLGRIGERTGYLKTAMFSLALTTITILLLNLEDSFNILVVPHLFMLSMTTFSLTSILQAHMAEASTTAQREILLGLHFTVGQGVGALWSTLLGYLVDLFSYKAIWVTMVFAGIGAMMCLVTAYRIFIKNRQLETKT
ncbi:MFS transporter, partial [Candidatus Bathyarchaeota archaeon]|nr:MFS transporter [Candidatus Bathyarchaeota archaeon]